jgi:hypothetical protein
VGFIPSPDIDFLYPKNRGKKMSVVQIFSVLMLFQFTPVAYKSIMFCVMGRAFGAG